MALIASGRERPFSLDELFACTTDRAGRIRLADDVFVRLSGYERAALGDVDVLRHPEMPRSVWARLRSGSPFAGYAKFVARDGGFYWAAVVSLPFVDGRLFVGFKASGAAF